MFSRIPDFETFITRSVSTGLPQQGGKAPLQQLQDLARERSAPSLAEEDYRALQTQRLTNA